MLWRTLSRRKESGSTMDFPTLLKQRRFMRHFDLPPESARPNWKN